MSITASQEQAALDSVPTQLLIGGEWRDAGASFSVEDPATGETLTTVASATPEDGKAALDAAVNAQHDWAATAPRERAEILRSAFDLITERADYFAMLMTLEMGKPLAQSKGEVTYGAEFFRWFSEEVVRIDPLEYRLRSYENRLVVNVFNPTPDPVTLAGERSYVVAPNGQSHPLRGQTIAPDTFVKMILPPMRPYYRESGPNIGFGLGVGISSRGHYRSGGRGWRDLACALAVAGGMQGLRLPIA